MSVSDGVHQSPPEAFVLTIAELRLRMATNSKLHVFPTMQQTITRGHLLAKTNDPNTTRNIVYTVVQKPRLGKITREGPDGRTREVSRFTQADINASRVLYEQRTPLGALSGRDAVTLRVQTRHARPLAPVRLSVRVSVTALTSGGLRGYAVTAPLVVPEGGRRAVSPRQLDVAGVTAFLRSHSAGGSVSPELRVRLGTPPRHGTLSLPPGAQLRQLDVTDGKLVYQHDHSDSSTDSFGYSLLLVTPAGPVLLYNGSVEVEVAAINDQPFRLETPAPGLSVVQQQTVVIGHSHLHVIDADNPPDQIVFRIINGPSRGVVERTEAPGEPVTSFSQEDVNRARLRYRQDGSLGGDQFHLSVSDGHHQPLVVGFVITIEPLKLELRVRGPAKIVQGQSRVVLDADLLSVTTNGRREKVFFNVTREPHYGQLMTGTEPASRFSLVAVDAGRLEYLQVDMQASNDSFVVTVYDELNVVAGVPVPVEVQPLVRVSPLRVVPDRQAVIGPAELDASQLAAATRSNPVYKIVRSSRLGFVSQRLGGGGGGDGVGGGVADGSGVTRPPPAWNLTTFTHAEVTQGAVVFVAVAVPLETNDTLEGGLQLELSAPHVQPARLQLTVVLVSADSVVRPGAAPGVNSVVGRGRWPPDGAPFSRDLLLVGGGVAAVAVGSVLLLVAVKCVTEWRRGSADPPDAAETLQRRPSRDGSVGHLHDRATHSGVRDQNSVTNSCRHHRKTAYAGVTPKCGDAACAVASLDRPRARGLADDVSVPDYSVSSSSQPHAQQWV